MDDLLKLLSSAVDFAPSYRPDLCLAVKQSVAACSVCRDVCPHDAIIIRRQVEIDRVDCTGCGLCVRGCPSYALDAHVQVQPAPELRCGQVDGDATSVHCLARLGASDMLRLAGENLRVTLARGDCSDCPIGTEDTVTAIEQEVGEALALARARDRDLEIELHRMERLDRSLHQKELSRRDLFRRGWRGLQDAAAEALVSLDLGGEEDELPTELSRRFRILEGGDFEAGSSVPWVLPRVTDGCIMCPVCTRVCPTGAFGREFEPEGREGTVLMLEPERCMGCEACVHACPVKVIELDDAVTWGELSGGAMEACYKPPDPGTTETVSR